MDATRMNELAEHVLAAWTSQDVDRVLDCYTDDVVYVDPSTRGPVKGRDALGRYLEKLFAVWRMSWSLRESHPYADGEGCNVLWRATVRRASGGPEVRVEGMDLVRLRGGRIARNEVVFDRSPLAAAEPPGPSLARPVASRALYARGRRDGDPYRR